jgi:proline racemase
MTRSRLTALTTVAVSAALLVPAASVAADPTASAAGEEIVSFATKGKLKVGKNITYNFVCGVTCNVKIDVVLTGLPGKNFRPPAVTGSGIPAGQVFQDKLQPNGPLLKAIKDNIGSVRLKSTIVATDVATGLQDTDKRTFKLKK